MQEPGRSGYRLESAKLRVRVPGTGEAAEDYQKMTAQARHCQVTATGFCSDQDKGRLGSSQHSSLHGNVHTRTFIVVRFRIGDAKVLQVYKQMTNKKVSQSADEPKEQLEMQL